MAVCTQAQKFAQEFGNPRKVFVETIATPDHADSYYSIGQTAFILLTISLSRVVSI